MAVLQLDGVDPVDNRPSNTQLNHFKENKEGEKIHLTLETLHLTHDMWHVVGGEHSLKIAAP